MALRNDKLNRLVIQSECDASWEEMEERGNRRYCGQCEKEVLDFARMTAREIRSHLEAKGGKLCARLTRRQGQLVVAEPEEAVGSPSPFSLPALARRASPIAATLVGAWLGVGLSEARAGIPSPPSLSSPEGRDPGAGGAVSGAAKKQPVASGGLAAFHGRVFLDGGQPLPGAIVVARNSLDGRQSSTTAAQDGSYSLDLSPGVYDLSGQAAGFLVESKWGVPLQAGEDRAADLGAAPDPGEEVTAGVMAVQDEPLRLRFDQSDLVVVARAGGEAVVARQEGLVETAIELTIETTYKGSAPKRTILYRHWSDGSVEGSAGGLGLSAGTRVLGLLKRSDDIESRPGPPAYESSAYHEGLHLLSSAEGKAYTDRVEALARLERRAEKRGETDPSDLMEWLVGTAEEPLTRSQSVSDLAQAVGALERLAEQRGTTVEAAALDLLTIVDRFRAAGGRVSEEPKPELLAATLTEAQKGRLTAALRHTETFDAADLTLFRLVRDWDEQAADRWLLHQLRTGKTREGDDDEIWRLSSLANGLGNEKLRALVEVAQERQEEVADHWPDDESEATERLRWKERAAIRQELRKAMAEALGASQ